MSGFLGQINSVPNRLTNPLAPPRADANTPPNASAAPAPGAASTTSPAQIAASRLPTRSQVQVTVARTQTTPDTGLLGRIKSGLSEFKAAVSRIFSRPAPPPPVNIPASVTITVGGQQATIMKEQYEQMIMSLPQSQRASAVARLPQTLSGRVNEGLFILQNLQNVPTGGYSLPATPERVAHLTLALYALAAAKGEGFTNGSFSVTDQYGNIAHWLDSSSEVYLRSSSHLEAYQGMMVDGHVNMQRGIDIPEGVDAGLPNGHRTVLYGTIPAQDAHTPRRLFLKTESAGCRISTACFKSTSDALGAAQTRGIHLSDIGEMARHLISYIKTRGQQGNTTARKEHFPQPVSDAYKAAVKQFETLAKQGGKNSPAATALTLLTQGGPAKGGGVWMLRRNIAEIGRQLPNDDFSAVLGPLNTAINSMQNNDHPNIRLGNEVIID